MRGEDPIREEELHAYVDGVIEPARRLNVALYLADHPMEAARAEAFRAQTDGMHALFDEVLERPLPKRLRSVMVRHTARAARRRRCLWGLAAVATTVLLLGGALSGLIPIDFDRSALIGGPAMQRQSTDTEYPVIRPPAPHETRSRSIAI